MLAVIATSALGWLMQARNDKLGVLTFLTPASSLTYFFL
jgi:hypothetical protein